MSTVAYRHRFLDLCSSESVGLSKEAESNLNMEAETLLKHFLSELVFQENLQVEFQNLVTQWKKDTRFSSSLLEICTNSSYQQIIGMGEEVLPLIFDELKKSPGHWFWALKAITRIDPVNPKDRGNLKEMTEAWLFWWEEKNRK